VAEQGRQPLGQAPPPQNPWGRITWEARLGVASYAVVPGPLQDVLALGGALDVVEPDYCPQQLLASACGLRAAAGQPCRSGCAAAAGAAARGGERWGRLHQLLHLVLQAADRNEQALAATGFLCTRPGHCFQAVMDVAAAGGGQVNASASRGQRPRRGKGSSVDTRLTGGQHTPPTDSQLARGRRRAAGIAGPRGVRTAALRAGCERMQAHVNRAPCMCAWRRQPGGGLLNA